MSGENNTQKRIEKPAPEQKREERTAEEAGESAVAGACPEAKKAADELKADMDNIMAEIDIVLEENADLFVRSYHQQGGE